MNVYRETMRRMKERLERKTGWGRKEVIAELQDVLDALLDEELEELRAKQDPRTPPGGVK